MAIAQHLFLMVGLTLFAHAGARAEGYTDIWGKLADGREVHIDREIPGIWVWRRAKNGDPTDAVQFEGETCLMTSSVSAKGRETRTLECPSGGKSPVAGTKYLGRPGKNCSDFAFIYSCSSGCGSQSPAPKKLWQEHWECE